MNIAHIASWIADLFARVPHDIKKYAAEALQITTALKAALQSDLVAAAVAAIPGTWDDNLRAGAVVLLTSLGQVLQEVIASGLSQEVKDATRSALLNKIHSELIALQDGHALSENKYDLFAQVTYSAGKG